MGKKVFIFSFLILLLQFFILSSAFCYTEYVKGKVEVSYYCEQLNKLFPRTIQLYVDDNGLVYLQLSGGFKAITVCLDKKEQKEIVEALTKALNWSKIVVKRNMNADKEIVALPNDNNPNIYLRFYSDIKGKKYGTLIVLMYIKDSWDELLDTTVILSMDNVKELIDLFKQVPSTIIKAKQQKKLVNEVLK